MKLVTHRLADSNLSSFGFADSTYSILLYLAFNKSRCRKHTFDHRDDDILYEN
jgi:hypothetical protein